LKKLRPFLISALLPVIAFVIAIAPSDPAWKVPVSIIGILTVVLASYYEIVKPAKRWEENRELICSTLFRPYLEELRTKLFEGRDVNLRVNVMGVRRSFYPWKENSFDFKYQLNMEGDPDQNLKLSVSQGLCGEAYREQTFKYVSMVQENPPGYNLSPEQREKTKHLKTIISVPIWEIFSNQPSKRRVNGVLNIDSKEDLGKSLFDERIFKDLTNKANFIGMIPIL